MNDQSKMWPRVTLPDLPNVISSQGSQDGPSPLKLQISLPTPPLWTGSCPCQPFSTAGTQTGFEDERHLWPHFHWLIQECCPAVVLGEQVASKVAEPWIDLVSADMEGLGYAFGAVAFPSASIGAPHIRDRTYWVAHADDEGLEGRQREQQRAAERLAGPGGVVIRLADTADQRRIGRGTGETRSGPEAIQQSQRFRDAHGLADTDSGRRPDGLHALRNRKEGARPAADRYSDGGTDGVAPRLVITPPAGPVNGFWRDADWLYCRDGKWRPVGPGTFPLAHGVPGRVGRLRAYGNAINVYQAAEFIRSAL